MRGVLIAARLMAGDLARDRVAMGLLLVIPAVFFLVVFVTTGHREIAFQLSALGDRVMSTDERDLSILFIGMTIVSGLSAFLALVLVLRQSEADRRLVFEGYGAGELWSAKLLVTLAVAIVVAVYVALLLPLFARPGRGGGVFGGTLLISLLYGLLGLAVGCLVREELAGILFVLLLVNLDAGWLQNPVFYGHARNQELIRWLPGHHPGQVAMLSAFSDGRIGSEVVASIAWIGITAAVTAVLYVRRVRVRR
jgi:hypothetical protein